MPQTAALLIGHGSRAGIANAQFEALVAVFRDGRPDLHVAHGYVELAEPHFETVLSDLADRFSRVVLVPVFLFTAGHIKNDLPLAMARAMRRHPHARIVSAQPLGVHPDLAEVAHARVCEADPEATGPTRAAQTAVLVVGRGSSDPDANGDFCKLVRLVGEGRGYGWVLPAFVGITEPSVEVSLQLMAKLRPSALVVVPYMLFAGRLIERLQDQLAAFAQAHPWVRSTLAQPLGAGAPVQQVLGERLAQALDGTGPLPCDACQYRRPIGGIAEQVGGLQALLWSVRHGVTHTQSMPHEHAHAPVRKHVLVCGNVDCADRESVRLISVLRRELKQAGRQREIRVTRTSCLGRCGEGPTVAIYPDGVWYRGVQAEDASELVHEHLLGERLVARLVDNVMQ